MPKLILFAILTTLFTACGGGGGGGSSSAPVDVITTSSFNGSWNFEINGNNHGSAEYLEGIQISDSSVEWTSGSLIYSGSGVTITLNRGAGGTGITHTFNGVLNADKTTMWGTGYDNRSYVVFRWSATKVGNSRFLNPDLNHASSYALWDTVVNGTSYTIQFQMDGSIISDTNPDYKPGSGQIWYKGGHHMVFQNEMLNGVKNTFIGEIDASKTIMSGIYTGNNGSSGTWTAAKRPSGSG